MEGNLIFDERCEMAVVGIIATYENYFKCAELSEEMFAHHHTRKIYHAMKEVAESGQAIDVSSVSLALAQSGLRDTVDYLFDCTNLQQSTATFSLNCERLRDLWKRRTLRVAAVMLAQKSADESIDVDKLLNEASAELERVQCAESGGVLSMKDAHKSTYDTVNNNLSGERNGMYTGFRYFDNEGGFQNGEFVIIAGATSQGKTAFALDVCLNAAISGVPCACFSMEMSNTEIDARLLGKVSGVRPSDIMRKPLAPEQLKAYDRAIGSTGDLPIYFDDRPAHTVESIVASVRKMSKRMGVRMVIVDYLQILQANQRLGNMTEEQFFGVTARRFQQLAKELGVCVVLLSQLHRDHADEEPNINRLRGSGQIAEAADTVIIIWRPEYYGKTYEGRYANVRPEGTALVKIVKGRNIGTGEFICGFDSVRLRFFDLDNIPSVPDNRKQPF